MGTTDAHGNIHDSGGRFNGHVRSEPEGDLGRRPLLTDIAAEAHGMGGDEIRSLDTPQLRGAFEIAVQGAYRMQEALRERGELGDYPTQVVDYRDYTERDFDLAVDAARARLGLAGVVRDRGAFRQSIDAGFDVETVIGAEREAQLTDAQRDELGDRAWDVYLEYEKDTYENDESWSEPEHWAHHEAVQRAYRRAYTAWAKENGIPVLTEE